MINNYLFTSESVSRGHPDKIADQISDRILDEYLLYDRNAKVALETLVTTDKVILCGEVKSLSKTQPDHTRLIKDLIKDIGYIDPDCGFSHNTCKIELMIKEQAEEINKAVVKNNVTMGAGDQGIMFGYATRETPSYMPLALDLSHRLMSSFDELRNGNNELQLMPDGKAQVTIQYVDNKPVHINTVLVSLSHKQNPKGFIHLLEHFVKEQLLNKSLSKYPDYIKYLFNENSKIIVNPSGSFTQYGPAADTGLTGRKIIVDTYGGAAPHGGGAFSGKDPSKVDRAGTYMARYAAKNLIEANIADRILIQVAYGIGLSQPISFFVNCFGTNKKNKYNKCIDDDKICESLSKIFNFEPDKIILNLGLNNPIYSESAYYGHFGREIGKRVIFDGCRYSKKIDTFSWEKTNKIREIKEHFNL